MHKLLSLVVLLAIVFPIAAPALAMGQDADSLLPACCRRHGKHHCAMNTAEHQAQSAVAAKERSWQSPLEHCPYCPAATTSFAHSSMFFAPANTFMIGWTQNGSQSPAQAARRRAIARERARGKRGPPALLLA